MWQKVAHKLQINAQRWNIAETLTFKHITAYAEAVKNRQMFILISCKAGIGKTATLKAFSERNKEQSVFYIQAREWGKRDFLTELCRILGVETGKGHISIDNSGMNKIVGNGEGVSVQKGGERKNNTKDVTIEYTVQCAKYKETV